MLFHRNRQSFICAILHIYPYRTGSFTNRLDKPLRSDSGYCCIAAFITEISVMSDLVVFLYFFEKTAAPEPIHLMTEVTSILDSICKFPFLTRHFPRPKVPVNICFLRTILKLYLAHIYSFCHFLLKYHRFGGIITLSNNRRYWS